MDIKHTDIVSLFEDALAQKPQKDLDEVGIVLQVGDNICRVHGLKNALYGEVIHFEGGNKGVVFNLDEDYVSIFLLYNHIPVEESEVAKRTGHMFKCGVGMGLLGRVVNVLDVPLDSMGPIEFESHENIEQPIAGVVDRMPISQSLSTGTIAIDSLVPIGRGQRELIIGNRNTGKTALAINAIMSQKDKKVYCIYVSIGQRQANVARLVQTLQQQGVMDYSVVVAADAGDPVLTQYLAPFVGSTIAEYFRSKGFDALIVYDDLTNHATAYREMSLLLRRPPGREAYPGDVFYLHSRLLERAGRLASGASITALPIVQIQADDITAYIPTNLISITDGQIFLDTRLFNQGIRPAVNVGLSVSRVGGAAQTKAMKRMTKSLRLELAQYNELLDFAQFGTELDEISQRRLARGERAVELLKQAQFVSYSFVDECLMLFLLREKFLDILPIKQVHEFASHFVSFVQNIYKDFYDTIYESKEITDDQNKEMFKIAREFSKLYVPKK
ncbi:MAG TPA: F0F1 ATP synthase subunit alpha [Candidatus Babeliales bacterium]|nr:F0F1 ATP synthase subunit alpha [Candidatus Babeliales bacterium]